MTNDEKIKLIGQKILILSNNLDKYKQELEFLQSQLNSLSKSAPAPKQEVIVPQPEAIPQKDTPPVIEDIKKEGVQVPEPNIISEVKVEEVNVKATEEAVLKTKTPVTPKREMRFEEWLGSRGFSIIGIITLVIGIAIGVKYAIDKDLINEVTRLVLGYVAGTVILVLALFYKRKYEIFSSVLLSGAMAVMYFTTYVGYVHYHFYNAPVAFVVMALFTGFTVYAAYIYNYEVVALLALVGGYSLPLLLSTGGGEIQYMFGFMLVLNGGILALSFVKYWKFVNHVAYALTWLIFAIWMASSYKVEVYLGRTLFFATAFYLIFYLSFISYKIFRNKPFSAWDIILVLSNSLIYFGIGYTALNHLYYEQYQGLFCALNAFIHLGFAMLCRKKEVSDKTIFYFIISMVISFITMAIPVQLDGNFVTITWITEMLVLLYMSKRFGVNTYKYLAYAITLLSFGSLLDDWSDYSHVNFIGDKIAAVPVFANHFFLTGIYAALGYAGALYLNRDLRTNVLSRIANIVIIILAIFTSYQVFANEILMYFDTKYLLSETKRIGDYGYDWTDYDYSWKDYSTLWMLAYSMLFVSALAIVNFSKFKNRVMAYIVWGISIVLMLLSLSGGLSVLSGLREKAFSGSVYEIITTWNYNFRYVYLPFVALFIGMFYMYRNSPLLSKVRVINTWLFHAWIIVVLCNELTHIMIMTHMDNYEHYRKVSYRMGYTVLWGLYSMGLITYGILRKRKMLRIIAIALFGLTVFKLAIDAMSMSRGYQLVVFITIGVILLTVSFMYQKFKPLLFGDENKPETVEANP